MESLLVGIFPSRLDIHLVALEKHCVGILHAYTKNFLESPFEEF